MTMLAALTLLPAMLGFAGKNIDRFGLPHRKENPGEINRTIWWRWSRVIQAHPWPALHRERRAPAHADDSAVLHCASVSATPETGRKTTPSRQAYDLLSEGFGPGFNGGDSRRR